MSSDNIPDLEIEPFVFQWPYLFEKSDIDHFAVGPGWAGILETFFETIYHKVQQVENRLEYYREECEKTDVKDSGNLRELIIGQEKRLEEFRAELPTITSVRQKFGTLRIGMLNGTDEHGYYLLMAQSMSKRICEDCGSPGKMVNMPGTKVLCEKHERMRQISDMEYEVLFRTTKPKFDDEE